VRQLVIEVLNITDARCDHEVYGTVFNLLEPEFYI